MDSPARKTSPPPTSPLVPAWAEPRAQAVEEADAAFLAGAALHALDLLVRSTAPAAGCWRKRQALGSALAALRLMNRETAEQDLRDALLLSGEGGEAGPAGAVLLAFRKLTRRTPVVGTAFLSDLAPSLGIGGTAGLGDLAAALDDVLQSKRALPFLVADLVRRCLALRPDGECLAWWLADWLIAEKLGWARPVPLLMAARYGPAFRARGGRGRMMPDDPGFGAAVALAIAGASADACRAAAELSRRAADLETVLPKLRSKGAAAVAARLLDEDCLLATAPGPALSRWAAARLFERLQALGAVRELSGRPSFKVYGL